MHKGSTTIAHFLKTEDTVILNLIGTGCKVYVIPPNTILFHKLGQTATKLNMPLQQAILDAEFFKRINNNKFKNISSIKPIRGQRTSA